MDQDEQRRVRLQNWAAMTERWERACEERERVAAPVTDWLVRALAPKPGDAVLELAAGQGEVGSRLRLCSARADGSSRVTSARRCSRLRAAAARNSASRTSSSGSSRPSISTSRENSVDGVLCRWGYMLMPNPATALTETWRVLRPGRRLAFAVWASGDLNPWILAAGRILLAHGHKPPPERGEPGMFVLANEKELRALIEDAANVQLDNVPVRNEYRDVDDYVRRSNEMGGRFSRAWTAAPEDQREAMTEELRDAFEPLAVDGGYELPGLAICVLAS